MNGIVPSLVQQILLLRCRDLSSVSTASYIGQQRTLFHELRPLSLLPPLPLGLRRFLKCLGLHLVARVPMDDALSPLHSMLQPPYLFLAHGTQVVKQIGEQLAGTLIVVAQCHELTCVQIGEETVLRAEFVRRERAGDVHEPRVSRFLEWWG